jgi:uncharacterized membrane protein
MRSSDRHPAPWCAALLVAGPSCFVAGPAAAASFIPLPLPFASGVGFRPADLSDDGRVVVGWGDNAQGIQEAMIWDEAGGVRGIAGGIRSRAQAVSADGSTVVGSGFPTFFNQRAFRWDAATGLVLLPELFPGTHSGAGSISDDGSVITGSSNFTATRWDGETVSAVVTPTPAPSASVSGNGLVLLAGSYKLTPEGVVGPLLPLGDLGGVGGLNRDGSILIGASAGEILDEEGEIISEFSRSLMWTDSLVPVPLGDLPDGRDFNWANDLSDDGSRVVGLAMTDAGPVGYLWTPDDGMRAVADVLAEHGLALEIAGWSLEAVTAITPDGRTLVGYGVDPTGARSAWLAHIPEPGVAPLLALGLAVLEVRRRRA